MPTQLSDAAGKNNLAVAKEPIPSTKSNDSKPTPDAAEKKKINQAAGKESRPSLLSMNQLLLEKHQYHFLL